MSDPTTRRRLVPGLIDTEPGLVAHPGPQQYACAPGVYDDLPRLLTLGGYRSIAILHGRRGWEKARRYLPESLGPAEVEEIDFAGECSPPEIERVAGLLIDSGADAVIGVGGGKVLDTTKAAALRAGAIPAILLPTLASNCSAWANLSVLYEPDGTPIGHEIHPVASAAVLVEHRGPREVLASAGADFPARHRAGLADVHATVDVRLQLAEHHQAPSGRHGEIAGAVENVDLAAAKLNRGDCGGDTDLALDLLLVIVANSGAGGDLAETVNNACEV